MPNTEGDIFANAGLMATGAVGGTCNDMVEQIKDLLIAGGWTLVETTYAGGWLHLPGWMVAYKPTTFYDEGKAYTTINDQGSCQACVSGIGGETPFGVTQLFPCANGFWNFYVDCLGNPLDITRCNPDGSFSYIGADGTHDGHFTGTFESFAFALTGCSPNYASNYFGTDRDGTPISDITHQVFVQAENAGPKWNAPRFVNAIGVGFANGGPAVSISGGGYRLRSQAANNTTQYEILVSMIRKPFVETIAPGNVENLVEGNGTLSLRVFELYTGSEVEYNLAIDDTTYTCITNPYTLFLSSDSTTDSEGVFFSGGNSFLATAPYSTNPNLLYCLLVIGGGALKNSTTWNTTCSMAINSAFQTFRPGITNFVGSTYVGVMCRNFPYDGEMLTTSGRPLRQTAWVMGSNNPGKEASVLGVLWNSFVVSKAYPHHSQVQINGFNYTQVSRQITAPECSLWMGTGF
jgi:hypothetical protein